MSVIGESPQYGVYTLGSYGRNYPIVLDFTYPISLTSGGSFVTSDLEVGSMLVDGNDIFVSWYDHTSGTYGVDKVDYLNKVNGAYFETQVYANSRDMLSTSVRFVVAYCNVPDGTNISISYSVDEGVTWVTTTSVTDVMRNIIYALESPAGSTIMMRVILTSVGNDAPSIEAVGITIY